MRDQRPHVVVVGPPGSGTTSIGAELARVMQEPFLDVDMAATLPSSWRESPHPPSSDELDQAQLDWLNAVLAGVGPYVVAAPWCACRQLAGDTSGALVVVLDAEADVLHRRIVDDGVDPERATAIVSGTTAGERAAADALIAAGAVVIDTSRTTAHEAVIAIVDELERRGSPGPPATNSLEAPEALTGTENDGSPTAGQPGAHV